jgi:hypothetical protein
MSRSLRVAAGAAIAVLAAAVASAAPAVAAPSTSATGSVSTSTGHSAGVIDDALAAGGRVLGGDHPLLPHGRGGGATSAAMSSYNWAGYAKQGSFTSASATWTVPTTLSSYNGYASTWLGLDGFSDSYLTQTGIEEDVRNGRVSYDAWWEIITPSNVAPEVVFSGFTIRPGDSITGTVTATGSATTLTLKDNTTGKTATHSAAYAGPGTSAEWIQEDTDVNGFISAAPDWQRVAFSGAKTNGASAGLTSSESIDIVDSRGTRETATSAPNATHDGFTVTWLATGTKTRA